MDRVVQVVTEVLGVDAALVTPSARFIEDLGASSLQSIELVAAFEEEFDIEMDEDKALAVQDVGRHPGGLNCYLVQRPDSCQLCKCY